MSAAMLLQAWGDTLLTTGLLVAAILLIRKPFARAFGPGLTYALWAIPALRFLLPPLPFAAPTPAVAPQGIPADVVLVEVADTARSDVHPSELPSLMRHSYAVFCLQHTQTHQQHTRTTTHNIP